MNIEVTFFGQLTDKTGCRSVVVGSPGTVGQLKRQITQQYPALANATYTVAVNNTIAGDDELISDHSKVAFLPPFSGG